MSESKKEQVIRENLECGVFVGIEENNNIKPNIHLDAKLKKLRTKKQHTSFFIVDENFKVISEGFKTRVLANSFISVIRFSSKEKLKVMELEDNDGKIKRN